MKECLFFRFEIFAFSLAHASAPAALMQEHKIIEERRIDANIVILLRSAVFSVELHSATGAIYMPIAVHAVLMLQYLHEKSAYLTA